EDEKALCQCVLRLLPELPAGDAELLRRVDLGGESPTEIAAAANERVNTLNVRLLRARRKLREQVERTCRACATHGCLDCDCP
ncbi:MAG TPA: sigma factor-like helix-turn-helix DNA-binding protein, partial [Prosthecobacter sp.]|nr:sigma factor-like helix-turn-helix DNA-binding protein [Prosthecobacter sp.]